MNELSILVSESLDKYFSLLARVGKSSTKDLKSVLVLVIIEDVISKYSDYIDDKTIRSIVNALTCISGNCIIDYLPPTTDEDGLFRELQRATTRITQESIVRNTEDGIFRMEA